MTADLGYGASVRVTVADETAYASALTALVEAGVASAIGAGDATLWGPAAESEAAKRLAWAHLSRTSRSLADEVSALAADLASRGLDHVILAGMGGSSLAPEVIAEAAGVPLVVLDSSNPDFVRSALSGSLERAILVVSSKSGGTVETDSQRRAFEAAFIAAGIDPVERIVVVTDPGSSLEQIARDAGYRTFVANPDVGGRYSALTAFGLVPTALAGVDPHALLDEAEAVREALESDSPDNPALQLGALMGVAANAGVDKLVLADAGASYAGFGDWAEQLIAESTGKDGKGILPVVVGSTTAPDFVPSSADEVLATFGPTDVPMTPVSGWAVHVDGTLGGQMLLWEYATAIAGRIIGINPFDQPDVEAAKAAARDLLDGGAGTPAPAFTDGVYDVFAHNIPGSFTTAADAVAALVGMIDGGHGYLAVQAYLDRSRDVALEGVRDTLAERTGRPITFGWGPRFLHSTGQYHKGGPANGVYLQVTSEPAADLQIPGRPFTFQQFHISQAVGDGSVLAAHGRPILRLHLAAPAAIDDLIKLLDA
ncbi:glucose-6-phosphate isomerase [Nocardioides baekrokdamisoli]|uniref:Glucose-6-phosphate isomerase n=1 Tax=Nocardioides baekrokdamisoli TaxID=1804624 RepID=A0A3G9IUJ9_9ACTN|nr:glucose-6-phosphate isomerase [Nocardioides baekrokdamisoli]BBH15873.1 glucose-6-phosphate isomerase [Nocardioides baekrokdamisoli]